MLGEEVGEIERPGFGLVERREPLRSGEQLVAVGSRKPPDRPFAPGDVRVEQATGAAIGVAEHHRTFGFVFGETGPDRRHDALRPVVQRSREILHVDESVETGRREHGSQLGRQRSAREDERGAGGASRESAIVPDGLADIGPTRTGQTDGPGGSALRNRRAATSSFAVSAATAASRQYASAPTASPNSSLSGAPPTSTMYRSRSRVRRACR